MDSLILWIIALLVALLAISPGTSSTVDESPAVAARVTESLFVNTEEIERLSIASTDAGSTYVASSESLFVQMGSDEWERVGDAPPAGQIVFASDDDDLLLVGEQGACARGGGGATLHRSTDGGVTWQAEPESDSIKPLAIWGDSGLAVGASCEGLLVSDDLGVTWDPVDSELLGLEVTAFAVSEGDGRVVLASLTGEGGTSRLYQFDLEDPTTWSSAEPIAEYWGIAGLAATGETIYLASITGVSSTIDGGVTWSTNRFGLEDVTLERDPAIDGLPADLDPSAYGLTSIFVDNGIPLLVGSNKAIYEYWSTDVPNADSATWAILANTNLPVTFFAVMSSGEAILAQSGDSVLVLHPGPWEQPA